MSEYITGIPRIQAQGFHLRIAFRAHAAVLGDDIDLKTVWFIEIVHLLKFGLDITDKIPLFIHRARQV